MKKIILFEKQPSILHLLKDSLSTEQYSFISVSNVKDAFKSIEIYNPELLVLKEEDGGFDLLEFINTLRQNYSSSLPIILAVNFHSSLNLSLLKDLKVDFILTPFSAKEFEEKVFDVLGREKQVGTISTVQLSEGDILNKIKPFIKEEVRIEMMRMG